MPQALVNEAIEPERAVGYAQVLADVRGVDVRQGEAEPLTHARKGSRPFSENGVREPGISGPF